MCSLWLKIFGGFYPRSRKVSGCVAVRVRGREASAGEDAREPAGRAGFSAKEIFGGFRIVLTARRHEGLRGRSPSRAGFRLTQYGISPLRTKRNFVRFALSVTAFHFLRITSALKKLSVASKLAPYCRCFFKLNNRGEQATNGSEFWQSRGSAGWERRLAALF